MLELAASGAKVLQVRSVEIARSHHVKLHVRPSYSPADGTWIREEDDRMLEKALISGVTHTREETLYRVEGTTASQLLRRRCGRERERGHDRPDQPGDRLLRARRRPRLRHGGARRAGRAVERARRPREGERDRRGHEEPPGRCSEGVCDAGRGRHRAGGRDTSPIKIACHIPTDEVDTAVAVLHRAFELDTPEAERQHA
jgi:Aspartokinases